MGKIGGVKMELRESVKKYWKFVAGVAVGGASCYLLREKAPKYLEEWREKTAEKSAKYLAPEVKRIVEEVSERKDREIEKIYKGLQELTKRIEKLEYKRGRKG